MQTPSQIPLRTYRFVLTSDDTMIWLELRSEAITLGSLTYLLWIVLGSFLFGLIPQSFVGESWSARWIATILVAAAVSWAIDLKLRNLWRRATARRAMPQPLNVVLAEWNDRIVESWESGGRTITPDQILGLNLLETHLFIQCAEQLVIIPRSAFEDADNMRQFYERWDKKSAESAL